MSRRPDELCKRSGMRDRDPIPQLSLYHHSPSGDGSRNGVIPEFFKYSSKYTRSHHRHSLPQLNAYRYPNSQEQAWFKGWQQTPLLYRGRHDTSSSDDDCTVPPHTYPRILPYSSTSEYIPGDFQIKVSSKQQDSLEVYDIDTELPDLNCFQLVNLAYDEYLRRKCLRENGDATEPELYCFEDFVSEETGPGMMLSSSTDSSDGSSCHDRLTQSDSDYVLSTEKGKELQRSKTLPIIRTPVLSGDDAASSAVEEQFFSQKQAVLERTRFQRTSPDSSEYSGSCGSEKGSRFKGRQLRQRPRSLSRDGRRIFHKGPNGNLSSAWNFEDDTDSTTSSETAMTSISDDGSSAKRPSSQLFYTTPPKANMVRSQDEKRLESLGGFYKLTRRLSQKDRIKDGLWPERQRSVSLDCGDGRKIKVFMTDSESISDVPIPSITPSPSAPAQLRNMSSMHSPNRAARILTATPKSKRGSSACNETDLTSTPNRTYEKKKAEKKSSSDINALFEAVEQQDIDLAKQILETDGIHINSINSEGLTPLDVAVMTNNIPMAKMLLHRGARESPIFQKQDSRCARLDALVSDAEKRVVDLSAAILNASSGTGTLFSTQQKENERQLSHWEFRHKLLKRMKAGYDHARAPDPPSFVSLNVASSSALYVRFGEPLNHNGAVVTRYKVEWSCFEDFVPLAGEDIVDDMRHLEYEIRGLVKGNKYYVRVSAWNMKGTSLYTPAKPGYAVPSCWRDVEGSVISRTDGKLKLLEEMFSQVKQLRPADASEIKDNVGGDSPQQRKRKSIKNLFTSAPKFHKALKRGVYMACLLYHGDKVLVTSDDQLPVVEVDENFTGPAVYNDLHWLMKISCTWEDVKSFRQDMDKSTSAGTMHFRNKLLQAISILQTALGVQDLGQFHNKPLKDGNGSVVLTAVSNVKDPKTITLSSGKWVSYAKLLRRSSASTPSPGGTESSDCMEVLISSVSEMINYNKMSTVPLTRGLYLGYLKLQVSVEVIQLIVPRKAPNNLPSVKVRVCPNVSREEWEWIQSMNADQTVAPTTTAQAEFRLSLTQAAQKLFDMLGISENFAEGHRIYDVEIIEVSNDVTLILVLPPIENVCIVPGQAEDLLTKRDFMLLPVKVFEMIHLYTYRSSLLNRYSRLSSLLEMDLSLAQQVKREAFSTDELSAARDRVEQLNLLQQTLDQSWKSMRWVMDIITYARDKSVRGGIPFSVIYSENDEKFMPSLDDNSGAFDNNNSHPCCGSIACNSNEISVGKDNRKIAKFYDPTEDIKQTNGHIKKEDSLQDSNVLNSGILQVYAAYETGLSKGTRVRLHVTSRTTAREVVNLVVRQLNKALVMKGKSGPTYSEDQLESFCLVAVIGARERILRDDYQPLQLQNPWTKGRLYVRLKNNLLAAIQQGHATEV